MAGKAIVGKLLLRMYRICIWWDTISLHWFKNTTSDYRSNGWKIISTDIWTSILYREMVELLIGRLSKQRCGIPTYSASRSPNNWKISQKKKPISYWRVCTTFAVYRKLIKKNWHSWWLKLLFNFEISFVHFRWRSMCGIQSWWWNNVLSRHWWGYHL